MYFKSLNTAKGSPLKEKITLITLSKKYHKKYFKKCSKKYFKNLKKQKYINKLPVPPPIAVNIGDSVEFSELTNLSICAQQVLPTRDFPNFLSFLNSHKTLFLFLFNEYKMSNTKDDPVGAFLLFANICEIKNGHNFEN